MRLANRGVGCSGSSLRLSPVMLFPKPSFSLTFQWANNSLSLAHLFPITFLGRWSRALPRLFSVNFFYPKSLLCSTVSALINTLSKLLRPLLWNPFCTRVRTHTLPTSWGRPTTASVPVQWHYHPVFTESENLRKDLREKNIEWF